MENGRVEPLQARRWRSLENPWRLRLQRARHDVYLKPDDLLKEACDVSQRVGILKKAQLRWLLGQTPRGSLGAGCAAIHRSLEVEWRHRRMDTQLAQVGALSPKPHILNQFGEAADSRQVGKH